MIKYEIRTDHFEFRFGTYKDSVPAMTADEILDAYQSDRGGTCPTLEESFDNYDECKAEFDRYYSNYGSTYLEKGWTFYLLRGEIAWVEENEYDEDGEFFQGGTVFCFSAEPYTKVED